MGRCPYKGLQRNERYVPAPPHIGDKLTYPQVITSVATQLLGEHSHSNNFVKRIMTLYMYASGAQRQAITVISHLGISESYNNLIAKASKPRPPKDHSRTSQEVLVNMVDSLGARPEFVESVFKTKPRQPGTLRKLSASMRDMARNIASTGLFAASYDNINLMFRAAEQIIGRSGEQLDSIIASLLMIAQIHRRTGHALPSGHSGELRKKT